MRVDETAPQPSRNGTGTWRWVVGALVAAALLFSAFRGVRAEDLTLVLAGVPAWGIALVLAPPLLALSLETLGWRMALHAAARRVALRPLLGIRGATEAVAQRLPGGAVWCETLQPRLLARWCALPVADGVAAIAARHWLVRAGQAVWVCVVAAVAHPSLSEGTAPWLAFLPLALAAAIATLAVGVAGGLGRSRFAERVFGVLARAPWRAVRDRVAPARAGFEASDRALERFFAAGSGSLAGAAVTACSWACEALDTWVIFVVLGVPIDPAAVIGLEALLAIVRHTSSFLPAGLGA